MMTRPHYLLRRLAAPHLKALSAQVVWPSDLFVRGKDHMLLVETSRKEGLLGTHGDLYGHPVDFELSAAGRCYLAFCPERERQQILARIKSTNPTKLMEVLETTRERGYARAHPDWHGQYGTADRSRVRHMGMSVPVIVQGRIRASLNLLWVSGPVSNSEIIRRHEAPLRATAKAISDDYVAALHATKGRKKTDTLF
jgi:IclR family mhp operon transcriptional activator